jgi:uncharacterized protein YraI
MILMRNRAFWLALLVAVVSLSVSSTLAQGGVRALVVNEFANVRIVPAIGAEVLGTVPSGYVFETITARSPDDEWLRVDFNGNEGWVHVAPLRILDGNVGILPVADPRTIPYGGFESPRAGLTSATSPIAARLPDTGVRVRAGPSTGYPVLAEAPRFSVFPLLGRTANNAWAQINFEGTLGWVAMRYLELQGGSIIELPIDGIVAESLPISQPIAEDFVATLRLMLARLDLAQPSLDAIRAMWTDAALTGRAHCRPYPTRPSSYHIPNPLLAAFYFQLEPLSVTFNDAMFNVRRAIDLFIEACNQPGTQNPVGQATVIGALETIALADRQFADLRRRLQELIPPDREVGPGECLFVFRNEFDILRIISIGELVFDEFSPRRVVTGFCFDAIAGQSLLFETIQLPGSNVVHLLSVSPFDNPTNFIAVGRGTPDLPKTRIGPVLIPQSGRYLLVLSNLTVDAPPTGRFAIMISDAATLGIAGTGIELDPATGEVRAVAPAPGVPGVPGAPPPPDAIIIPPLPGQQQSQGQQFSPAPSAICPGLGLTCQQLTTCDEAWACYNAGNFSLDGNNNGIPCENLCGAP